MACDDSHLPAVQAGNLGTSYTPRAKKSLQGLSGVVHRMPWTWLLPPTLISWYATLTMRQFEAMEGWGLPSLTNRQLRELNHVLAMAIWVATYSIYNCFEQGATTTSSHDLVG